MIKLHKNKQQDIFIYEFIDDLYYLKKKLEFNKNILVISTNFRTSYQLKKNKIKFIKLYDFYRPIEHYQKIVQRTLKIPELLSNNFFKIYKNFYLHRWNIFDDYFYRIKQVYDQLYFYSFCLNEILNKYKIKKIYVRNNDNIKFNEQLTFITGESILSGLLKSYNKKIQLKLFDKPPNSQHLKKKIINLHSINSKLKYLFEKSAIKNKINNNSKNIISLYCNEVDSLIHFNPYLRNKIINLRHPDNYPNEINLETENNKFIKELKKNYKLKDIFIMNNFDTNIIFNKLLLKILPRLNNIYKEFQFFDNLINKDNTKLVIFSTLSPINQQNIIINKICDLKKINKAVWCHGGYYHLNLGGYEVTDYKSCKNHLAYGTYIKDLTNNKNFLPTITFKKKYNSFAIGSPKINLTFNSKNNEKQHKKSIIFVRGVKTNYNQLYFPIQSKNILDSAYNLHENVLNILKPFQFEYDITFKNYSLDTEDSFFWKTYLNDNGMDNIKLISDEKSLDQLYKDKQLVILPWLSTSFFQALPYKNKIFMYDQNSIDNYFGSTRNEINFFNNKKKFLNSLNTFIPNLQKSKFSNNKNAINYFLNGNKNSIMKENFDVAVNKIVNNK